METRIRRLVSELGTRFGGFTPDLANRAIYLYRKARKMRLLKKPGLNEWSLGLIYAACRERGIPITLQDIVGNNVTSKEQAKERKRMRYNVNRHKNLISKSLKLKHVRPTVEGYITYFGGKMRADQPTVTEAIAVSEANTKLNAAPHVIAAAALYISLDRRGKPPSQRSYCHETNISEISLRNWCKQLGGMPSRKPSRVPEIVAGDID